jgi:hypothetical protein
MSVTVEILSQRMEVIEKQIEQILHKLKIKNNYSVSKQSSKTNKKTKKNDKKNSNNNQDEHQDTSKKKKISGYILFSTTMRSDAKNKLTTNKNSNPKQSEIMKELGTMWNSLTNDEQDDWKSKANKMK